MRAKSPKTNYDTMRYVQSIKYIYSDYSSKINVESEWSDGFKFLNNSFNDYNTLLPVLSWYILLKMTKFPIDAT